VRVSTARFRSSAACLLKVPKGRFNRRDDVVLLDHLEQRIANVSIVSAGAETCDSIPIVLDDAAVD